MKEKSFKNIRAAGYYRLSREDGDKMESDSITNQRLIISEYSQRNGIQIIDDYIDDGYSGTNFDRPSFIRLMMDINDGKINCIIVKDLSRLGRNYIEMGRYMSRIFPSLGVRLISINDNYDSFLDADVSSQIVVPFKNLINDAYCRDISLKIRSQLDIKRKNGQYIGSFALFGYKKDEENHNHLVIDETAAEIVQLIFNMKLDGYNSLRICSKLNELKIPTPLEYKRMFNAKYNNGFRSSYKSGWGASSIDMILKNEMYTGVMVQGKRRKINYKIKQSVNMKEDDWIKVQGTHDAIIPKEIYDLVQKMYANDTRTAPDQEQIYSLSGVVKCGTCGCNMVRRSTTKKGVKYFYYHCRTYKNGQGCTSHIVSEKVLEDTVLANMRGLISTLSDSESIIEKIEDIPDDRVSIKLIDNQIISQRKEVDRYAGLKAKLYQDMCENIISREEFRELNAVFTEKMSRLEAGIVESQKKRDRIANLNIDNVPWIRTILEQKNIDKLDNRMVISMIDSITVFDKDKIVIKYNYAEEFNEILAIIAEIRNAEVSA